MSFPVQPHKVQCLVRPGLKMLLHRCNLQQQKKEEFKKLLYKEKSSELIFEE